MQQTRVIGIPRILGVELPIAMYELPLIAQQCDRPLGEPLDRTNHHRAEIVTQRFNGRIETREDKPVQGFNPQHLETMLGQLEAFRHATLAADAASERHTLQLATQIVGPLVIHTFEMRRIAAQLATHQRAAMRAAVLQHIHTAFGIASDDDRGITDEGRFKITRLRNLTFKADKTPHGPAKYRGLFARVERG